MKFYILFSVIFVLSTADPLKEVANSNLKFTVDVHKLLNEKEKGTFICSGLSAVIILSLVVNGAKGETQKELLRALHLPNNQSTRDKGFNKLTTMLDIHTANMELSTANKMYPDIKFNVSPTFKENAVNIYKSEIENLNYKNPTNAANTINKWVESKTNNKIKNLIDPKELKPSTVLVLVNTLYLKGKWLNPFQSYKTSKQPFYISSGETKSVDMMYNDFSARYQRSTSLKVEFLELDLGNSITMGFILPGKTVGLKEMESYFENFNPDNLKSTYIGVYLPKFQIETTIDFTSVLRKLGVNTIFSDQADLSGISTDEGLKVSFIIQKAFINVTESGIEAAAATEVGVVGTTSIQEGPSIIFRADHPFMYYVRDKKSGVILFTGRFNG